MILLAFSVLAAGAVHERYDKVEASRAPKLLVEAITQLPESERLSITLYYMEELRLKEIGQVLNLSESRVSRLLKSAEQPRVKHAGVHLVHDHDPRILPELRVELSGPDVDRIHPRGPSLQEAVGEATS